MAGSFIHWNIDPRVTFLSWKSDPPYEWMNIYFTEVFRLVHHFTCIYTSSWISHTSDSHKSFNIDIYISFVLPAVRASFIQGLYFWFRVLKVIIPVYQYITKFFLRFSTWPQGPSGHGQPDTSSMLVLRGGARLMLTRVPPWSGPFLLSVLS